MIIMWPNPQFSSKSQLLNVMPLLEDLKYKIQAETEFREPEKLAILDQMFPPRTFAADGNAGEFTLCGLLLQLWMISFMGFSVIVILNFHYSQKLPRIREH